MIEFLDKLTRHFFHDLAIDLGSTNTLIYLKGRGIIVNEPSLIAFERAFRSGQQVVRTGAGAKELLGRNSGDVTVVKPVRHGVVADFAAARAMLFRYLERVKRTWFPAQLRVIANVPARASEDEKACIRELVLSAGAREVYLMEEPRALAIGAGLDISEEKCNMVVDIGGGITEMAIVAGGRVVRARSLPIGGEHMDQAIADYVREHCNLRIDAHVAERIKIQIGEAYPTGGKISIPVEGYDVAADRPGFAEVTAQQIGEALSETLKTIIGAIKAFLESLTPRQCVDIIDRGIALAGGGALLRNLDRRLERELSLPFLKVRDPLTCLVLGSGDALDYLNQFRRTE